MAPTSSLKSLLLHDWALDYWECECIVAIKTAPHKLKPSLKRRRVLSTCVPVLVRTSEPVKCEPQKPRVCQCEMSPDSLQLGRDCSSTARVSREVCHTATLPHCLPGHFHNIRGGRNVKLQHYYIHLKILSLILLKSSLYSQRNAAAANIPLFMWLSSDRFMFHDPFLNFSAPIYIFLCQIIKIIYWLMWGKASFVAVDPEKILTCACSFPLHHSALSFQLIV